MASGVTFAVKSPTFSPCSEIHSILNPAGRTAASAYSYATTTTTRAALTLSPRYAGPIAPSIPASVFVKQPLPRTLTTRHDEDDEVSSHYIHPGTALSEVWRKIQGVSNWRGLINPLHPLLCAEILRYGEMVNACYKAFDMDSKSKRYLNCKYSRRSLLRETTSTGVPPGYEVTKYIYAAAPDVVGGIVGGLQPSTSGSCSGRWIGYVAVSGESETRRLGRRDIVVAFRGTVTQAEWAANFMSALIPARLDPHDPRPDVKVEEGFLGIYTSCSSDESRFGHGSCREQLLCEVARLLDEHSRNREGQEDISVSLTGHSMGSSLAILLAYDLAELGLLSRRHREKPSVPVTVYSFAGPRVGNLGFRRRCEELGVKVLRLTNVNDPVTKLPGVFNNEKTHRPRIDSKRQGFRFPLGGACDDCYAHVGVEVAIDFFCMKDPSSVHDLGHYLGLLRCPPKKKTVNTRQGLKADVIKKLMQALGVGIQNIDSRYWTDAAINVAALAQSLGF